MLFGNGRQLHPAPARVVNFHILIAPTNVVFVGPTLLIQAAQNIGDELPAMDGRPIREDQVQRENLREGDLLFVQSFYESGEIKLASRLIRLEADRFLVTTARVPSESMPGNPKVGDHFLVRGGSFEPRKVDPHGVWFYKLSLRFDNPQARLPHDFPLDLTQKEVQEMLFKEAGGP